MACFLLVLSAVITGAALAPIVDQPWDRCDPGRLDAPRFSGGGDQYREQVAMEIFVGFAATVSLAAAAFLYLRRLAVRRLPFYIHSTGIYFLLSLMNFGIYTWHLGLNECMGAGSLGNDSVRSGLMVIAFLCEMMAWLQLQLCILWKAQAVAGDQSGSLGSQLLHCVVLYLPAWMVFAAYYVTDDPSTVFLVVLVIIWVVFVAKFAYFTLQAARKLFAASQVLSTVEVMVANKSDLVNMLNRHAYATIAANLTTILLFISRVTMKPMGTLAVEFVLRYVDLANNVITVMLLSGVWRERHHNVDSAIRIVSVWRKLDEAKGVILTELGYDIGPKIPVIAEAAWISQDAYTTVLNQVKAEEGATATQLLNMESMHLYLVNGEQMLLKESQIEYGMHAQEEVLAQNATDLMQLVEEARAAHLELKARLAPGSPWALASPEEPAKLLQGRQNFGLPGVAAAYDPGVKSMERIQQKSAQKYSGDFNRVRDVARLALHFDTAEALLGAIPEVLKMFDVVQVENRFHKPTSLGWADVTVLVRMPVQRAQRGTQSGAAPLTVHIAEIQLQLTVFFKARLVNHKHYRIIRNVLPQLGVSHMHTDLVQGIILDILSQ